MCPEVPWRAPRPLAVAGEYLLPCPPAYAVRNSLKPRNLYRFAGLDVWNGLAMVQRQWFQCALQWVTHFQVERIFVYDFTFQRSVARCGALF